MTDRIVDIAETPARVSVKDRQLVLGRKEAPDITMPLEEVAVVVGAHRQVVYTQAALAGLMEHGGVLVACDGNSTPVGMMLPLAGHHLQSERFRAQVEAGKPLCKRLWRQVVRAKIGAQGGLLERVRGGDFGVLPLRDRVASGDPSNVEAQAARKYWRALFGPEFRREREGADANRLLNYGYAVLRAMTARAVCASGLHPSLGIHHHNRYNTFCLADDLMEPFRPLVDAAVTEIIEFFGETVVLDKETKGSLVDALGARVCVEGEWVTVFDALTRLAASLAAAFAGDRKTLVLPEAWWAP